MIRDILDYQGNKIGEMELPDDTSEDVWTERLAEYAQPPQVLVKVYPDVTPRQIRQALILSGVTLQQIDDAINNLDEPTRSMAKVEWEYSNMFQRNRPLVAQVAYLLGWSSQQIDSLWELAGRL